MYESKQIKNRTNTVLEEFKDAANSFFSIFSAHLDEMAYSAKVEVESIATLPTEQEGVLARVYRLRDSLALSHPIYLRAVYGTYKSSSTATWASYRITVGVGYDPITGQLLGGVGSPSGAADGTLGKASERFTVGDSLCHIVSGEGYFGFATRIGEASDVPTYFVIERSRGKDGEITGDGFMTLSSQAVYLNSSVSAVNSSPGLPTVRTFNRNMTWNESAVPVVFPSLIQGSKTGTPSSISAGSIGPVFPWVVFAPAVPPWQPISAISIYPGDHPGGKFRTRVGNCPMSDYMPIHGSDKSGAPFYNTGYRGFGTSLNLDSTVGFATGLLALRWE